MNQEMMPALGADSSERKMVEHPLVFTFQDTITGHGFQAAVTLNGRGLMVKEMDGKWWLYGVQPGAIAESGRTWQEAYLRFRQNYLAVLSQFAAEAASYVAFRRELKDFYAQTDGDLDRWERAVACVRSGHLVPDDFRELPRAKKEERLPALEVMQVQRRKLAPSLNPTASVKRAA